MTTAGRQFRRFPHPSWRLLSSSFGFFVVLAMLRLFFATSGDADDLESVSATLVPATPESGARLVAPLPPFFSQSSIELFGGVNIPIPRGWRLVARDDYGLTLTRGAMTIRIASIKNSQATAAQQFANSYPDGGAYTLLLDGDTPRLYRVREVRAEGLFLSQPGSRHEPRIIYAFYQVFGGGRSGLWYEATLPSDYQSADLQFVMRFLRAIAIPER